MPDYQEDIEEKEYKNSATSMQNATLVILFVSYCLVGWVWGGSSMTNVWFSWGGWIWLGGIALFKFTPMLIGLRSPKFSSNKLGTTIASPDPITTTEPQGGYPEMALYPAGSVMAMEFFDFKMSTKALVWMPKGLAYVLGEQDRGVNLVANCHLQKLAEHSELAPHLLEATKRVTRIGYKQNLPVYTGLFPILINDLPTERLSEYRKRFADLGISREVFDGNLEKQIIGVRQILDQYASETSKFKYGAEFAKPEQMQQTIIKSQNSLIAQLKADNKFWKSEISALHDLQRFSKDSAREHSWKDNLPIPTGQREQEREDNQENRGRY
jgi:hypothetical protein